MAAAAAKGLQVFTHTWTISFQPQDIKLAGNLWEAYKSGIEEGLASQDIVGNEVTVALNLTDTVNVQVDLNFSF